jgi:anti-anti-sigma factor
MDSALLTLGGEFDLTLRPELMWRLEEALAYDEVRLDSHDVTYIDAGSLRLIDQVRCRLTTRGGRFAVIRTSATFDLVSELAGYQELRRVVPLSRVSDHVIRVQDPRTSRDTRENR